MPATLPELPDGIRLCVRVPPEPADSDLEFAARLGVEYVYVWLLENQLDAGTLFEGAVICRYLAAAEKSELYPEDDYDRAVVDQWMDFFSQHLGRWINTLYFENVVSPRMKREPKQESIDEAMGFATTQSEVVDKHLGENEYLCGANLTIADPYAYAYLRAAENVGFSLDVYPNIVAWRDKLKARPDVQKAESLVKD